MYNLHYVPTTLGVQSWREIISGGTRTKRLNTTGLNYRNAVVHVDGVNCDHQLVILRWQMSMKSDGGTILTGESRRTRRKTCPSSALSTTNPTWIDTGVNPVLRCERSATNKRFETWILRSPSGKQGGGATQISCVPYTWSSSENSR
jgi:hypothetical protein